MGLVLPHQNIYTTDFLNFQIQTFSVATGCILHISLISVLALIGTISLLKRQTTPDKLKSSTLVVNREHYLPEFLDQTLMKIPIVVDLTLVG